MTIPYVTGTVSVTAGSAVVTGSGTAWATALVAGGLFGLDSNNGNPVPILSVDSNTQLTLAKPWRGTTAAGQGYWIMRDTAYLQQQTVNAQALSAYIQRLDNAALTALAGLNPSAEKFAYFTGANSGALGDIKAKGRDIMSAADMLGLLGKLGPVFGGAPPSPTGAGVGLSEGDFNTINVPGVYSIAGTWQNGPAPFGASTVWTAILVVHGRNGNNLFYQTLYHSTRGVWQRYAVSDGLSWPNAWYLVPREIVGAVGQSGGVPTGAIIERGTNVNGDYVRFADGTLICTGSFESGDISSPTGALYANAGNVAWTFPTVFSAAPAVVGAQTGSGIRWVAPVTRSTTVANLRVLASATATNLTCGVTAIGRWF